MPDDNKAHTFWKVTLRWMINGQQPVAAMKVDSTTECELGAWICGEGARFQALPAFQTLLDEHRIFHQMASAVVQSFEAGDIALAQEMMAPQGAFSRSSECTIAAIKALQAAVENLPAGSPDSSGP